MWSPQHGTVFVKKAADKLQTETGIHLPNAEEGVHKEGEVVLSNSPEYPVGTKILYSKFAGSEVKVDGESLFIMRTEDILAVWRDGV